MSLPWCLADGSASVMELFLIFIFPAKLIWLNPKAKQGKGNG